MVHAFLHAISGRFGISQVNECFALPCQTLPLRLIPGQDLRAALEAACLEHRIDAGFVLQGIGSLCVAQVNGWPAPASRWRCTATWEF
jgi:predicted DNA-binding protein with PD1-like motif